MIKFHTYCRTIFEKCFNLLLPSVCGYCKDIITSQEILCGSCLSRIQPIVSAPLCITKKHMLSVFAIGDYTYPLRALVQAKNYGNRGPAKQLGRLLWNHTSLSYCEFDLIVPVPLHWTRYANRWFNQSYQMAESLSVLSGKPVISLVKRTKRTIIQTGLSREARQQNVHNVFSLTNQAHEYKRMRILIVDDVMTTGSTLQAVCRALLPLHPKQLQAAVACRVVNK